ncbi:hypothetical protein GTX14_04910 [Streptomyces sp. SID4944]|nr:hypothetical protein [Streptomyces sp. SID4944]
MSWWAICIKLAPYRSLKRVERAPAFHAQPHLGSVPVYLGQRVGHVNVPDDGKNLIEGSVDLPTPHSRAASAKTCPFQRRQPQVFEADRGLGSLVQHGVLAPFTLGQRLDEHVGVERRSLISRPSGVLLAQRVPEGEPRDSDSHSGGACRCRKGDDALGVHCIIV